MSEAEENLRKHQNQLDPEGIMIGVSRQALTEVLSELSEAKAREALLSLYLQSIREEMKAANCCKCDLDTLIKDADKALQSSDAQAWLEGVKREARDKAKLGIASYLEQFENSVNCDEMAQLIRDDVARQSKPARKGES